MIFRGRESPESHYSAKQPGPFKHKCEKSCSKLEYFGQISRTEPHLLQKENWNAYGFQYVLNNHNFAAKVYEEYFIYDAMEMIGSVGGTLGI